MYVCMYVCMSVSKTKKEIISPQTITTLLQCCKLKIKMREVLPAQIT